MEKYEIEQSLINQISNFKSGCCHDNWDGEGSKALTEDTIAHGLRFIKKLNKYNLLDESLRVRPGSNTIIFTWKINDSIATIEFDDEWDRLIWCIEKGNNVDYGNALHLEEIVKEFKSFLGK